MRAFDLQIRRKTVHQDREIIMCQTLASNLLFIIDTLGIFSVQDSAGTVKARGRIDLAYRRYVPSKAYEVEVMFGEGVRIDGEGECGGGSEEGRLMGEYMRKTKITKEKISKLAYDVTVHPVTNVTTM